MVNIKFVSVLRDSEAKLRLLDGIKTKPTISLSEMTENLQFTNQAMTFASSSKSNRRFVIKEEVGTTSKRPSENLVKSSLVIKAMVTCVIDCGGKPHSSNTCPALNKKCNTCEKVGPFSKMCRSKTGPKSGKSDHHNNFCDEEGKLSGQTSSEMEMGMECTIHVKTCLTCR